MIKITNPKGDKKGGYILTVIGKHDKFKADMALTYEEIVELKNLLNKKIK